MLALGAARLDGGVSEAKRAGGRGVTLLWAGPTSTEEFWVTVDEEKLMGYVHQAVGDFGPY